jgi:hypothetical protein
LNSPNQFRHLSPFLFIVRGQQERQEMAHSRRWIVA